MKALAFANNDVAVVAWTFDRYLKGCLGFRIERGEINAGTWTVLPALAAFADANPAQARTTADAPVQKFWWKDVGARRGASYRWRITPMGGKPGALEPLAGVEPLVTNAVTLTPDRGVFKAFFNRGIVATQAVAHALGTASVPRLLQHVAQPDDPLRRMLCGQIAEGLELLLDEADREAGEVRGALYELNDSKGLEVRLQAADHGKPGSRAIVLGNSFVAGDAAKGVAANPDADAANRAALRKAGATVVDRILPSGHIPHNKFLVLEKDGAPAAVLTGSTNWTTTGLCTQTNNALVIASPVVAQHFAAYWEQLQADSEAAAKDGQWQRPALRDWCRERNEAMIAAPVEVAGTDGEPQAHVQVFFSPSTPHALGKTPDQAADMQYLVGLMMRARHAILFLAFNPGNLSIVDAAGKALAANPALFVRGTLTAPQVADNFVAALHATDGRPDHAAEVGLVASKPLGAGDRRQPDYRCIPAGAVTKDDAFGAWQAELKQAGHAIIHDKIVVIDPFDADCTVVSGSHNLGARASHNNDENFVVVRGHRALAEAYACHVLDVYDHFAWRYWLAKDPKKFGRPLEADDRWQARYIGEDGAKSPELQFWLSAVPSTDLHLHAPPAKRRTAEPQPAHA